MYKRQNSLNDKIDRVSKRVFVPGKKLRGFEFGRIGPLDGGEFIGGNYGSALNLTSDLPMFSQNQSMIELEKLSQNNKIDVPSSFNYYVEIRFLEET